MDAIKAMLGNQKTIAVTRRPATPRRNLLAVRANERSEHLKFAPYPADRTWDLMELNYGTDAAAVAASTADWQVLGGLSKWHAIHLLLQQESGLGQYDYVWLIDDDIVFKDVAHLDAMFTFMREGNLLVGQPSLTHDSTSSFNLFYHCPSFVLRYTNYVECMMPCFSRAALQVLAPTFGNSVSGWGIDLIWWHLMGRPPQGFAVVDALIAAHTRPFDEQNGGFYKYLRSLGINARDEVNAALDYAKMPSVRINVLGGVPRFMERSRATGQWIYG